MWIFIEVALFRPESFNTSILKTFTIVGETTHEKVQDDWSETFMSSKRSTVSQRSNLLGKEKERSDGKRNVTGHEDVRRKNSCEGEE